MLRHEQYHTSDSPLMAENLKSRFLKSGYPIIPTLCFDIRTIKTRYPDTMLQYPDTYFGRPVIESDLITRVRKPGTPVKVRIYTHVLYKKWLKVLHLNEHVCHFNTLWLAPHLRL